MPEDERWNREAIELCFLRWFATASDRRLPWLEKYFREHVKQKYPDCFSKLYYAGISEIVSSLLRKGLVYINFSNASTVSGLILQLTEDGSAVVKEGEYSPYDSEVYLKRLRADVPMVSPTVLQYAAEALKSFNATSYLASAVMLGVASEAAFLEMGVAFAEWLSRQGSSAFTDTINSKKQNYIQKFSEFRKQIDANKSKLPSDLSEGMALTFDSVLNLLRIYRNDSGHPTGKTLDRDTAYINLQMFARYLRRLYDFKKWFEMS